MHGLFHDIARHYLTLSPVTKKTTDIPGLGLKLNEAHAYLLNRYQSQTQKKGLWHTLRDDVYIHSHLTWHMEKAGRIEDIHALISEENENGLNGWYEALESLGQNAVFIEDVSRAWNLSEKESENQIEQGRKSSFIGLEIRYALIYTSINSLSANIPVNLLVAFLETKKWTEAKAFIYAQKEPKPYERTIKLISIYQKTKDESIKKELMERALDVASKIEDEHLCLRALSAIVSHLNGPKKDELIEKALDIASKIEDDDAVARTLSVIVRNVDGPKKDKLMEKVLDVASKIEKDYKRVQELSAIVPRLDGQRKEKVMEKAFDLASKIEDDYYRMQALSAIVRNIDGAKKDELMEKIIDVASKIENEHWCVSALSAIVPHINEQKKEKLIEKVLDVASNIEDDYIRVQAFSDIVPNIDGPKKEEVMEKTLDIASKIEGDEKRANALSVFIQIVGGPKKEEVIEKTLDVASKIKDDLRGKKHFQI